MKKISILVSALFLFGTAIAQKANIQSASNYLKDNDFANAKKMIDEATSSESSTKGSAKAWMLKAIIYQAIAIPSDDMPQLNMILNEVPYMLDLTKASPLRASTPNAYETSLEAYKKTMELDSKYEKNELMPLLANFVSNQFNDGINALNANKMADSYNSFNMVGELSKLDGGKIWKGIPQMDTAFATAEMYKGYCLYQQSKNDEAINVLENVMAGPIIKSSDAFVWAMDIYEAQGNDTKWKETIAKAKTKFPNDKKILNNEINYYLKNGKAEESLAKLKEGIAADPKNDYLYINLGQTQYNIAHPTDKTGKALPQPTNAKELEKDALANYAKASELAPNNYYSPFYTGLIYFNNAKEMTDEMNKADDKKYEAMKPARDAMMEKSNPFLDKAKTLIEKEGINDSNKEIYKTVLSGLMQSYMITGKTEKSNQIQAIIDSVK